MLLSNSMFIQMISYSISFSDSLSLMKNKLDCELFLFLKKVIFLHYIFRLLVICFLLKELEDAYYKQKLDN